MKTILEKRWLLRFCRLICFIAVITLTLLLKINHYRIIFEVCSAFGTTGLSMGITTRIIIIGKWVINDSYVYWSDWLGILFPYYARERFRFKLPLSKRKNHNRVKKRVYRNSCIPFLWLICIFTNIRVGISINNPESGCFK